MGRSQIFLSISEGPAEPPQNAFNSEIAIVNPPKKRRRWGIGIGSDPELGPTDEPAPGSSKFQNIRLQCSCKYSIKASCFITIAAIIELIGNTYSLAYGVSYIMGAETFFEQKDVNLSQLPQAEAYDDKYNRVTFLREKGTGLVALLATCVVGLVVSVLMPIGVFWKSWKSLRTAMGLLLAICVSQIIIASIYLSNQVIVVSLIAIPFRIYEIHLIHSYIRYYKEKKKRALLGSADAGLYSPTDSQAHLGVLSVQSMDNNLDRPQGQSEVTLDLNDGDMNISDGASNELGQDIDRSVTELANKRRGKKKRDNAVTTSISRWRRKARKGRALSNVQSESLRDVDQK